MRYDDFRRSDDIDDRRGDGGGGGGFSVPGGPGGLGIGTVLVLGLVGWALGIDPRLLIGGAEILSGGGSTYQQPYQAPRTNRRTAAPKDEVGDFVAAVLGENQDRWREIFTKYNRSYRRPRMVLFTGGTVSACGQAQAAMGPFYCPRDEQIYLDTSFFKDIETRFRGCQGKSACRFAQAYVIGHEFGHHVQNLLGIIPKVQEMQRGLDKVEANRLQVRVELQADCFAGLWAFHERAYLQAQKKPDFLEPGDIDAALQTASAIGDDTLQKSAGRRVVPDAFTHGSAEQRKRWFMKGYQQGTIDSCNTFSPSAKLYLGQDPHSPFVPAKAGIQRTRGLDPACAGMNGGEFGYSNLDYAFMPGIDETRSFIPLRIAVLTVSDTRKLEDDKSGATLIERIEKAGHVAAARAIVPDDVEAIRAQAGAWIADKTIDIVISTGGTGFTGRDVTPDAMEPLFEKRMDGFSTVFHMVSHAKIGSSTVQSRATAGVANATFIFCLPGSPGACRDAWDEILVHQLDYRYRPCNFVELMPRLDEHLRRPKAQGASA